MKSEIFRKFDWIIFIDVIILSLLGLLFIYSAQMRTGNPDLYVAKQSTAFVIGIAALLVIINIRYELYAEYTKYIYLFALFLLIAVLFVGSNIRGSKSWFDFGKFAFQPSEIAKIAIILYLAGYINKNFYVMKKISRLFIPFIFTAIYIGLILMEPDFSSALVFIPIFLGMIYVGGVSRQIVILTAMYAIVALGLPLLSVYFNVIYPGTFFVKNLNIFYLVTVLLIIAFMWMFFRFLRVRIDAKEYKKTFLIILLALITGFIISGTLKNYQRRRILSVMAPSFDPLGAGYNVLQSKIAIGSGRLTGRGLFHGTQSQLGFIPDQHTDFIFAVLSEEGGAAMSIGILLLYIVLIARGLSIAKNAADRFGSMIATGIVIMFSFYIILNLGMLTGVMPVAGVPLPFLSYGGSSLVINLIAVGILINIHIRRYANA